MKRIVVLSLILLFGAQLSAQLPSPGKNNTGAFLPFKYMTDQSQPVKQTAWSQSGEAVQQPPSRGAYMLRSLILPGWGERQLGYNTRGTLFTSAEVAIWLGYIGLTAYSDWRERDYMAIAADEAGVNTADMDGQYWVDIGGYDNMHDYNEERLRDRLPERVYDNEAAYGWDWPDRETRVLYDRMRIQSRAASKYATFMVGAMVVNRVLSALDVTYLYNTSFSATDGGVAYSVEIPLN